MALLYLKGMTEPVAIDYKDQVPIRATRDNPLLAASTGDGASAANIPGVVAGLDLLYRNYASKRIPWSDLVAPAIDYAESGYELDAALPTTIAEGRKFFEKYRSSARIYLPDGKVPKAGDRFVNKDYAATLRTIAKDGADSVLPWLDRPAHRRRHGEERRPHHARRPGAVSRHRAPAARRPLSRSPDLLVAAAGLDRRDAHRNAADPRELPAAARRDATRRDADYLHYAIESWRVRDQGPRIADPALWDVSLGPHLDPAHAATLFKRIDPKKASRDRTSAAGRRPTRTDRPRDDGVCGRGCGGQHDCRHADAEHVGRDVLRVRRPWLPLQQPSALRRRERAGPLPAARALVVHERPDARLQGHRLVSGQLGTPRLAVGAAGNDWIPASVYDIILNVIDGGMDAQHAIEAPRFLVGRDPADPAGSRHADRGPHPAIRRCRT